MHQTLVQKRSDHSGTLSSGLPWSSAKTTYSAFAVRPSAAWGGVNATRTYASSSYKGAFPHRRPRVRVRKFRMAGGMKCHVFFYSLSLSLCLSLSLSLCPALRCSAVLFSLSLYLYLSALSLSLSLCSLSLSLSLSALCY